MKDQGDSVLADMVYQGSNLADRFTQTESELIALYYPEQQIPEGKFNGYITHINSQQSFYIQRTEDTDIINDTTTNVTEEITTNQKLTSVQEGQACLAQFSTDQAWYRAQIQGCEGSQAKVLYSFKKNLISFERKEEALF